MKVRIFYRKWRVKIRHVEPCEFKKERVELINLSIKH